MVSSLSTAPDRYRFVQFEPALKLRSFRHLHGQRARPRPPRADASDPDLQRFLGLLLHESGLGLKYYRVAPLLRRVDACLRALRVSSAAEAVALLAARPDLVPRALSEVVLGVSEFFRDQPVFDELRSRILPELARSDGPLRVLSIGCSDGRELYSVAILAVELNILDRCTFYGLDCRSQAIDAARTACFSPAAVRPVPAALLERYFVAGDGGFWIDSRLSRRTEWLVADLFDLPALPPCDLLLFRNLAIYLEPNWVARAWSRVLPLVRPGGFLIAGKAERPLDTADLLRLSPCIFRRAARVHDG